MAREGKYGILVANPFHDKYLDVSFEKIKRKNIFATDVNSFIFVTHIIRMLIIKEFNIISDRTNTIENIISVAKKLGKMQAITIIIKNVNDFVIKKLNSELMQVLDTI